LVLWALISHEIRNVGEAGVQERSKFSLNIKFIHGERHASKPLVTFGFANRKRHVPHAEAGVSVLLDVQLWSAEPSAEEFKKFLSALGQIFRVHPSDWRCRRILIHAVVERIGEGPDAVFSTQCFKRFLIQWVLGSGLHAQSPCSSTDRNAFWGMLTDPTLFMRFLPSFCFSSNLRFRVMSPP